MGLAEPSGQQVGEVKKLWLGVEKWLEEEKGSKVMVMGREEEEKIGKIEEDLCGKPLSQHAQKRTSIHCRCCFPSLSGRVTPPFIQP